MKISKGQRVVISGGIILLSLVLKQLNFYLGISNILLIAALVTLAVIGAIFIGEYFEAAAVTFLFMLGNYLESKTLEKTRSAIKALLDLAPDTARVLRDDDEIELSAEEVIKEDIVIVKSGEKIPVDGTIKVVMLTGDNKRAVEAIARRLNLDDYYAELLPEDKVSILKDLQNEIGTAAMVGDGVNDSPALATADFGIAVGGQAQMLQWKLQTYF